ncbi:MAG: DUF3558 domain-containing protein [Mycolicibacterium cosmeticum]|nr:DUF3558 domain-containing protein [Mycolicibacterium cosmeticum]
MSAVRSQAAATVHVVTPRRGHRRFSGTAKTLCVAVAALPLIAACSNSDNPSSPDVPSSTAAAPAAKHGPIFTECGGISDQTIAQLTKVTGLVNTARNSVGCQWLAGGGIVGPHFSFTSFRGSPIGRERKTEELSRASVDDITIEGKNGFLAVGEDPVLGKSLCEIGIQFDDDFIEWSISFAEKPYPDPCDIAKELTRQSIVNAK